MEQVTTAASILFGFLFAGFWWMLDRELKFKPDQRHFKPAYGLLLVTMLLIAVFGVLLPLRSFVGAIPSLRTPVAGIVAGLVGIFGYMFTELAHYNILRRPLYYGRYERIIFTITLVLIVAFIIWAVIL